MIVGVLMPATRAELAPRAIRLRTLSRLLEIQWQDGTQSAWRFALLRQHCRCAACEAARRAGAPVTVATDIALLEVAPFGAGALRLVFSDGHSRGIYPYAYLRQLCAVDAIAADT